MGQADRTVALLERLAKPVADRRPLPAVLAPGRVAVVLEAAIAGEAQAQLLFSFAVNLLARLYPIVQSLEVVAPPVAVRTRLPRWAAVTVDEHARRLLAAVNPPVRWAVVRSPQRAPDCALVVGTASAPAAATVFAGADGWLASASPVGPMPVGPGVNPVGAYAAACLGVGEVCKRLLGPHRELFDGVPIIPIERPLAFSTFTYRTEQASPNPDLPDAVDLQRLTLVGVGAGGGALAFTLASLPGRTGPWRPSSTSSRRAAALPAPGGGVGAFFRGRRVRRRWRPRAPRPVDEAAMAQEMAQSAMLEPRCSRKST